MSDPKPDRAEIRRRLLLRVFGHPLTLYPGLVGSAAVVSPLLFDVEPALPLFVGVVALVISGASLAIRLATGRDAISDEVHGELEAEAKATVAAKLDALHTRLSADGDRRTEGLFSDVQKLVDVVRGDPSWRSKMSAVAVHDIDEGIDKLFEGCVRNLHRTLELQEMAQAMHSQKATDALLGEREGIIGEVERSVDALTELLTQLSLFGAGGEAQPDLASIRSQLEHTLAAASATATETDGWGSSSDRSRRAQRARNKENS